MGEKKRVLPENLVMSFMFRVKSKSSFMKFGTKFSNSFPNGYTMKSFFQKFYEISLNRSLKCPNVGANIPLF